MSTTPRTKRYYRDCYGNRAVLDDTGCGIVLIINPGYKSERPPIDEIFNTPWDARREMRAYSGNTWTEVTSYGYQ